MPTVKEKSARKKTEKPAKVAAKTVKVDKRVLKKLVEALGQQDEHRGLYEAAELLAGADAAVRPALASEGLAGTKKGGFIRTYLKALSGDAAAARQVVERGAKATSGRALLVRLFGEVVDLVQDPALVLAAAQNLEVGDAFDRRLMAAGIVAAQATGDRAALAAFQDRQTAYARLEPILSDLRSGQEKKQKAGAARLKKLVHPDRGYAAWWIISAGRLLDEAVRWARAEALSNPRVPTLLLADTLNRYVSDDDEEALRKVVEAGAPGPSAATGSLAPMPFPSSAAAPQPKEPEVERRVIAAFEHAVERDWGDAVEHLTTIGARALASEAGFAAVERLLQGKHLEGIEEFCDEVRRFAKVLSDAQAARLAELLLELFPRVAKTRAVHAVHRAFFYLEHPGAVPVLARALATEKSLVVREQIIEALENIETREAQDLLIDALFQENVTRNLIYTCHKVLVGARHADLLRRLEQTPSVQAAAMYLNGALSWDRHARAGVEVVERVLAWKLKPAAGDKPHLKYIFLEGTRAALELRRYDLARHCWDAAEAIDAKPKEPHGDSYKSPFVEDKELAKQLRKLLSGELGREGERLAREAAVRRAAGKPANATDEQLGQLTGSTVSYRVLSDRKSGTVWFVDSEDGFHVFDGYGIVEPPPLERLVLEGKSGQQAALAAFARDLLISRRSVQVEGAGIREVLLAGERLLLRTGHKNYWATATMTTWALRFPEPAAAAAAFEMLSASQPKGLTSVDPCYLEGKKGGTLVRIWSDPPPDKDADDGSRAWVLGSMLRSRSGAPGAGAGTRDRPRPTTAAQPPDIAGRSSITSPSAGAAARSVDTLPSRATA
jgi:hypothetical protein